jgi:cell division protein FtsQ
VAKKTNIAKALRTAGWFILVGGVLTLLSFVDSSIGNKACTQLVIELENNNMNFIEEDDIKTRITDLGNPIIGSPMASLDLGRFEEEILNMAEVEASEVYATIDGKVVVSAKQRRPIFRVINSNDSLSVYVDDRGHVMPWSNKYTARVLVVNGHLTVPRSGSVADVTANDSIAEVSLFDDVYLLGTFIEKDKFWRKQIQQVYVAPNGDFELIPRVGGHIIMLGSVENMAKKFMKLKAFYKKGLKNADWNRYSSINLKYKDQIVCTKKQ